MPEGSHNSNKGSSQYRGVSWHERSQRWEVRVWGGGKQHFIGKRSRRLFHSRQPHLYALLGHRAVTAAVVLPIY